MRAWLLVLVVGCYQPALEQACSVLCTQDTGCPSGLSCENGRCGPPGMCQGVADDARTDAPPGCFGDGDLVFCPQHPLTGSVTLAGPIDTGTDTRCERLSPTGIIACVIAAQQVVVNTTMATGLYALVIVGDQISIPAGMTLDVSSHLSGGLGPGRRACQSGSGTAVKTTAGGGGAGGSFGTLGGAGGNGTGGVGGPGVGGAPGILGSGLLYGGCDGGGGGGAAGLATAGGGGGVAILIGRAVKIDGAIHASGAAGDARLVSGGGGGGSGGSIVIIAPALGGTGTLYAIGGGGGGGNAITATGGGGEANDVGVAVGGSGGAVAGKGGDGGGAVAAGAGTVGTQWGGGGGGGAGRISLRVTDKSEFAPAFIIPDATTP